MPDTKFSRDPNRFDCLGIDLNRPVDSVKEQKFVYLQNMRSYQSGRIEPRMGLTDLGVPASLQTPVHSCRRLNETNALYTRVIGAGTHLAYGAAGAHTNIDSGYSGDPLALVPWRPDQSPTAYMYVADRLRMRKLSRAGVLDTIGYARPNAAPAVALDVPYYNPIDEFSFTPGGWTLGEDATAGPPLATTNRITPGTTIAGLLYDSGSTGWGCCWPSDARGFGPGARITVDAGGASDEGVTVQAVYPGSADTTIAAIIYDAGAGGMCSIILATPLEQVAVDALLLNNDSPELVRIVGVTRGPDGNTSIRVATQNHWSAGQSVTVKPSFRAYFVLNHPTGEGLQNRTMQKAVTYSTGTATFTKVGAMDLSHIAMPPDPGISTHDDDYMHIAFKLSRPDLVTEIRVQLDVDASTNDFTRNYYMRAFRASDIADALRGTQSLVDARSTTIQRTILDSSIPSDTGNPEIDTSARAETPTRPLDQVTTPSDADSTISQQLETGENVWFDMRFRVGELIRVGTDDTRTLRDVAAIRITLLFTGSLTMDMDSWWIGGGFGPDAGSATAIPYLYRYRARNPATGARSNWSPETRLEISPWRQQVLVRPAQYTPPTPSLATTDFVLDIQRFGGEIPSWHYVGFTANTASPLFTDKFGDDIVGAADAEPNINYQPWPTIGTPVSGTTGIVAGTSVNDSGSNFNLAWAAGTEILINGIAYTIYRVISTARLELYQNAGAQLAKSWRIDEPILLAQNLPCLWGDEQLGAMFACGDPINPGRLYFSNGNNPDSTVETNYIDITSPSEPLMNGVVFNLRSYVFSTERMFQILRQGDGWIANEIPNGQGLFSRWAITRNPSPAMFFLGKDGIYASTGGEAASISDADLFPWLPNEGNLGMEINNIAPPIIVAAEQANLRLEFYDSYLYFDYVNENNRATMVRTLSAEAGGGWFFDSYSPGVVFHYGEEGPNVHSLIVGGANPGTGRLYQYAGDSDDGAAIVCGVRTAARDQGDARSNKLYGDILLDADTQGVAVTCTPYINNYTTALASTVVTTASRLQTAIPAGTTWTTARNIGLELVFTIDSEARPLFYLWEPRYTFEAAPISATSWQISPTSFGMENWKHFGLFRIAHVSTVPFAVTVTIDGVQQPAITIPPSGGIYVQTVFRVPVWKFKLAELRIASTTATELRLDGRDSYFQVKEWGSEGPYQPLHVFGDYAMVEG